MRRSPILVLAVLVGCGDATDSSDTTIVADSAGVTIVRSTVQADVQRALDSERLLTLGGADTLEESFYRVHSSIVGTDAAARLYVLDRDTYTVQVFEADGTHVRTMGGRGGGPGELQFPFALTVAPDGRAWVADVGKQALVNWDSEGGVGDQRPLPSQYLGGEIEWSPMGFVVPERSADGQRLVIEPPTGERTEMAAISAVDARPVRFESCGMSFSGMEPIFSPTLVWTAAGNRVAVARNPDYVIDLYEDGGLARSIRRDLPRREATRELAIESLGEGMQVGTVDGTRTCDPTEVVDVQGVAPFLPLIGSLALAPDGTLWVQRFAVGDAPAPIDLFGPDSGYLGTLPEGTPMPVGFLPDGRILVSEQDALEVQRLVVLRVGLEP